MDIILEKKKARELQEKICTNPQNYTCEEVDRAQKMLSNLNLNEYLKVITQKEFERIDEDYKTTISETLKYHNELKNTYKKQGFKESDPMIMVLTKFGTMLIPVKIFEWLKER